MSILAIDGDILCYKAAFVCEKKMYDILPATVKGKVDEANPGGYAPFLVNSFQYIKEYKEWLESIQKKEGDFLRVTRVEMLPASHAFVIVDGLIKDIIDAIQPEQTLIYLTGETNFRYDIATLRPYKESRQDKAKPQYHGLIKDHLVTRWGAVVTDGEEADDAVATLSTACQYDGSDCIIATIDKDLQGVPGWNYNFDKKTLRYITQEQALRFFYTQMLTGDATDCIPGVPGVGEKRAERILADCHTEAELYAAVKEVYDAEFGSPSELSSAVSANILLEQARLLHMRRYVGEMWQPPVVFTRFSRERVA